VNTWIVRALAVIATLGAITGIAVPLWILIGSGLLPWWIAIPPAVVLALIGLGIINKAIQTRSPQNDILTAHRPADQAGTG
jgi:hypothetical protein